MTSPARGPRQEYWCEYVGNPRCSLMHSLKVLEARNETGSGAYDDYASHRDEVCTHSCLHDKCNIKINLKSTENLIGEARSLAG